MGTSELAVVEGPGIVKDLGVVKLLGLVKVLGIVKILGVVEGQRGRGRQHSGGRAVIDVEGQWHRGPASCLEGVLVLVVLG